MTAILRSLGAMIVFGMFFVLSNFGGTAGCGGGTSSGGSGDATVDTVATTNDALTAAGDGLSAALTAGLAGLSTAPVSKSATVNETVSCEGGGMGTVSGTAEATDTGFSFELTMSLSDCAGLTGTIEFNGSGTGTETSSEFQFDFSGSAEGNGCDVVFDGLEIFGTIEGETETATVNGSITATCTEGGEAATVNCSWNNVDGSDTAALDAGCTCSGTGCS